MPTAAFDPMYGPTVRCKGEFGDGQVVLDAIGPEEREIADRMWKLMRRATTATGIAMGQNAA